MTPADPSPQGGFVDSRQVRRNFARAASRYDAVSVLQREVASRMLERLDYVKISPKRVLDVGCGTGGQLVALGERYRDALVTGADFSEEMLRAADGRNSRWRRVMPFLRGTRSPLVAGDACQLPFRAAQFGLVWSNLMVHWLDDPRVALREMHRMLEVDGLLMFTTFGPDTLKELRASFSDAYAHIQRFTDMHDLGDMLVETGFADPVMDVEKITMTYASFDDLCRDLQQNGAGCAMADRRKGLMGKSTRELARQNYSRFLLPEQRLPATFEVVFGHAWKPAPRVTEDGRAIVRFDSKRRMR